MKIGLVRRGYSSTGGAEAYLRRLAGGLVAAGHVPVLIGTSDWPTEAWPNEFIIRVPGRTPREFAQSAGRAMNGCDVIYSLERVERCDVYRAGDGVHRAWLDRRAEFEPAWRRWTRLFNRKHAQLLALERRVYDPAVTRFVLANSALVRREITRFYGYPEDRITVVANGVDGVDVPPGTRETVRAELGLDPKRYTLLFAGSGWDRKGLRFAVEASKRLPDAVLLVAGKGDSRGLTGERVRFLGPVADMGRIYAAADVFVLPTIYDPFSNACLEALAAGLPVITTNANGVAEILTENVQGSTAAVGDVERIYRSALFWADPQRRAHARPACQALAARFSVAENVRGTLTVLERAVQDR